MSVKGMNHFTILTDDQAATEAFYGELLGLKPGWRPPFDFPGAWLYAEGSDQAILHVVAGRPLPDQRAGVLDHMAFTATGLADVLAKLKARGIGYDLRRLPSARLWQLFFLDPNGAKVELDFDGAESETRSAA